MLEKEMSDAKTVDTALHALSSKDIDAAEKLLLSVIENTPVDYINVSDTPLGQTIRFWSKNDFIHYVTYQREKGISSSVIWRSNAYPRAYYYLGFISVHKGLFSEAMNYLDKGEALEPTNPKFYFEKAQALVHMGQKEKALLLYKKVDEIGPFVSASDLAIAHRGCGCVLIDLERLDEAESAFKESLMYEPENANALNELQYIGHLRKGGGVVPTEIVTIPPSDGRKCYLCGNTYEEAIVCMENGVAVVVCKKCENKMN